MGESDIHKYLVPLPVGSIYAVPKGELVPTYVKDKYMLCDGSVCPSTVSSELTSYCDIIGKEGKEFRVLPDYTKEDKYYDFYIRVRE